MGLSGIGVWQLLIVLAIVVMLFGTKKLRSSGEDIGAAIRNFKQALNRDAADKPELTVAAVSRSQDDAGKSNLA